MAERTAALDVTARRFRLGSPRAWARALGVLAVLSFAAAVLLGLLSAQLDSGVIAAVIGVPCAAVGMVVTRRQRENPLGWLFLVIGICLFLSTVGADYAVLAYRLGHRLPFGPVALALNQLWGPSLVLFTVAILLFPDGRLPSRFWRGALWVYVVWFAAMLAAAGAALGGALAAHPLRVDNNGGLAALDYPAGWYNARPGPAHLRAPRAVAGLHRPPGAELAACHRRAAPAAEMAGQRRRGQHHLPVPGGELQLVGATAPRSGACLAPSRGWASPRYRSPSAWRS